MSQIDNDKVLSCCQDILCKYNNREITAIMEYLMENRRYTSGNPDKRRAANSYMKIAHGKNDCFHAWKDN
jgi:hypothetical protein